MNHFRRSLKDALRFWPLLLLATLCSVAAGALWGANIGALFPVIEVTIAGEPLQDWNRREISSAEQRIAYLQQQAEQIKAEHPELGPEQQLQLEQINMKLKGEHASIESSQRLQPWIDKYLPRSPFQTVVLIIVILMIGTAVKHVFQLVNTYAVALVAARIGRQLRNRTFAKALALDQATFSEYGSSGVVGQIAHVTDMLTNGITAVYGGAIREPLKMLSCLIGASFICWRLLLLSLVVVPVVMLLIVTLSRSLKSICRKLLEQTTGMHHVMLEALNNIRTVQAYTTEPHEQARFDKSTLDMQRFSVKLALLNALTRPITEVMALGMMGTAIVAGAYLVLNRATGIMGIHITDQPLSVASMLVFFGLLVGASDPVRKLSTVFEGINTGIVAANMLYPLLDRESRICNPAEPKTVCRPHSMLRFDHVTFAYDGHHEVLRDNTLDIPFGTKVAIVGPNGAGKSSFINLICRFYDPQQGSVLLDGVDLRDMQLEDLRGRIGLVTQNTELFNENLLYNIGYGARQATREQILEAAQLAHAHPFIMNELPAHYETMIGQAGHRLSGGQRQRIALARAILRDPEILILDEATSQIDVESERLIHETLKRTCQNRTVIYITHRHTMLETADMIIRFERGSLQIEQRNRHEAA